MTTITVPPILPAPKPRPRIWLRILLALLIFLAGLTFGGAATAIYVAYRFQYALRHPDELPTRLAARLTRRLQLTDTQESQIREILTQRQSNLRTIRTQFQPQVLTQLEGVHTDIGNVLTPQREKWDTLYDDLMRSWMPPMPEPSPMSRP